MHPAPFKIFEMTLADGSSLIQEIPTEKHFFRCEYFTFGDKKAQMLENKHLSFKFKKHETGFEPATLALARRYSTTEPLVHIFVPLNKDTILKKFCFVNTILKIL